MAAFQVTAEGMPLRQICRCFIPANQGTKEELQVDLQHLQSSQSILR